METKVLEIVEMTPSSGQLDSEFRELSEMELVLTGGGQGDICLG